MKCCGVRKEFFPAIAMPVFYQPLGFKGTLLLFSKCIFIKLRATAWESERSGGK